MVDARSTIIAEQDLPLQPTDYTGIHELRSRGVLQAPVRADGVRVGDGVLGFTHHLLHDYAIAAALIPRQPPQRLVSFIAGNPLLPIFYRQSFVFALEELWDAAGNGDRQLFWDAALRLENASTLHSITRIVAPILAARRVQTLTDLQPLLDALATQPSGNTPAHRALDHLVSGVNDALPATIRTGADGWLRFAAALSTLLPRDAALEWPLVRLLNHLNALDETQPLPSRALLNDAGRRLLAECLASARRQYSMNVAIVAVCQSFNTAPAQSRAALLALLDSARLARFPHHELSQLARGLKHLGPEGEEIVSQLFEAIFTREPTPGDWEERGSVLSSMRLQTSDQWNSIRHTLANYYEMLGNNNADLVTKLACLVSNSTSHRHPDKAGVETIVLATVPFRGVACELVEDFAHICGHGSDDNRSVIVSRFREHLRGWAAANDQPRLAAALDRFARAARNSSLWSVVLEIGTEYPAPLGTLLEPVLDAPLFQMHPDYRYAGVELLAALHRIGDPSRREWLERLGLSLQQRHRAWRQTNDALEQLIVEAQRRLLGRLRDADLVLEESRALKAAGPLPGNERPDGIEFFSHTYTDEEVMAERGIELSEPANAEMFRLRDELKHFLRQNNRPADPAQIELRWPAVEQSEHALAHADSAHPQMARELWGYLAGACANTAAVMNWPADDARWLAVRRVLLKAATDLDPVAETDDGNDEDDEDNEELKSLSWVWPAPRINAAEGLPSLARRLGTMDEPLADTLRRLSGDGSNPLRNNLAQRLFLLHAAAPALMWELLEAFAAREPRFIVLTGAVEALGHLWSFDDQRVESILDTITARATASAPAEHPIHFLLASTHLFHYLRTGGVTSEHHVAGLIATCETPRADGFWSSQLHGCRAGGWLTSKQAGRSFPNADSARQRTWKFFLDLLAVARPRLDAVRAALRALDPGTDPESEPVRRLLETRDRLGCLVDHVAMQIYFASGAFDDHQTRHDDSHEPLSFAERRRFWNDAAACLASLADEAHPSVAHHLVQTLAHLLPCAPGEIFLLACRSIRTSAAVGGFQYEPQAVGEVVKLVQRILADYPGLLTVDEGGESPVFTALLEVLDVFVEAGWPEARRLTHSLEDIYR